MKSPLTVAYIDLIKLVEKRLEQVSARNPDLVKQGAKSAWSATHEIACYQQLLRLLKKHRKNPQLNLEDLFKSMKR